MDTIKKLLGFLSTLWGALAVAAVAFPGAAALLKLPIAVKNSTIAGLYPAIGTIVSAFSTLFLIAYKEELSELKFARKLALWGMSLGLFFFFAFVSVRAFVLDVRTTERIAGSSQSSFTEVTQNCGLISSAVVEGGQVISVIERGHRFDVLGLALFAGTFAGLAFGFTALGIHTYQKNQP